MILTELSAIQAEALPVAAVKKHLRLGTGFADDTLQDELVEAYLRAAIATIEGRIGLVLIPRFFSWQLTGWRHHNRQVLPVRPITQVSTVTLFDRAGGSTSLDETSFDFFPDALSPSLVAISGSLPPVPSGGSAEIVFEAGYGPDWDAVPSDLAQAVILLTAHFYEHRTGAPVPSGNLPMAVSALLERHRPLRIFGGAR